MIKQVYYEDISVGNTIPPLVKRATTRQLVMWAGAAGEFDELHYDKDFAQNTMKLPGVIIQGHLIHCFVGQLMTDWIGIKGKLTKLHTMYRGMAFPGEDLTCKGKVTNKYAKDGEYFVECNVWAENPKGEKIVPGTATVILPSRS